VSRNDFAEDLRYSLDASTERFWEGAYRAMFPNFHHMELVSRRDWQRKGIDRIVYLANGNKLKVDEKKRRREYNDILLEYISNDRTKTPGWVLKDMAIDYLAYAFMSSRRVYFFPFPPLYRAWLENGTEWFARYGSVRAVNNGYVTHSVPVPIQVLLDSIQEVSLITVQGGQHALPKLRI